MWLRDGGLQCGLGLGGGGGVWVRVLDFLLEALHEGKSGIKMKGPYNKDRTAFRVYALKMPYS